MFNEQDGTAMNGGAQRSSPQAVSSSKSEPKLNIADKIPEQEGLQVLNTQGGAVYQIKTVSHCDWDENDDAIFEHALRVESFKNIFTNHGNIQLHGWSMWCRFH